MNSSDIYFFAIIDNFRVWMYLLMSAVKPRPSGRGYKARTASSDFRFFFHSIVYNY